MERKYPANLIYKKIGNAPETQSEGARYNEQEPY